MFNMGGPIKQGVMHGIREPYKDGTRAALVGNPIFPKDKTGRAHHLAWFGIPAALGWAARAAPWAMRGARAGWKYIKPTSIPRNIVTKSKSTLPIGMRGTMGSRTTTTPRSNWQMSKEWIKENPWWAGSTALYGAPAAGELGYKAAKGPLKAAALQAADLAVPDWLWDQDKYFADKEAKKIVSGIMKPGGFPTKETGDGDTGGAGNKVFAGKQREKRVQKYLEMMGYDRSKKTAIADALIDASKIVSDRGTLDLKNISRDLINPIIQATSKRLDKPEQIREAVGLMSTKAEIEKDLSAETDALAKTLTTKRIEALDRQLEEGVGIDLLTYIGSQKGKVKSDQVERVARLSANKHGVNFKKVTDADITAVGEGASEEEVIQSVVGDDGVYMIGEAVIEVKGGIPNRII
jgi:hypothetical protein